MEQIDIGKFRGLQEISDQKGLMTILALDQRGSLIKSLGIDNNNPLGYEIVREFKMQVTEYLLPYCSAILLDPEYSAAEAMSQGLIAGQKGLVVATEESGYIDNPAGRENRVIENWSLAKAKRMGASAAKLLVYYNHNYTQASKTQEDFIAKLVKQSKYLDLPLLIEPMSYSSNSKTPKNSIEFSEELPDIVQRTVMTLGNLGVDILKLEFPCNVNFEKDHDVWYTNCVAINEVSPVPWLLLSAGVDFSVFQSQLSVACQSGASGFVAGRAIWKEATQLSGSERIHFLRTTAVDRVKALVEIVHNHAEPWTVKYQGRLPSVTINWLSKYTE